MATRVVLQTTAGKPPPVLGNPNPCQLLCIMTNDGNGFECRVDDGGGKSDGDGDGQVDDGVDGEITTTKDPYDPNPCITDKEPRGIRIPTFDGSERACRSPDFP